MRTLAGLAGENTQVIDLEGRTMTPGLIENHNHLIYSATMWPSVVRLGNIRSRTEALAAIAAKAEERGPRDGPKHTVFAYLQENFADTPEHRGTNNLTGSCSDVGDYRYLLRINEHSLLVYS